MKKRVLLIPASAMILSSCTQNPDMQNKYATMEDCLKDNSPTEIREALCKSQAGVAKETCEANNPLEKIQEKYKCSEKVENGEKLVLGPAYPSQYYDEHHHRPSGGMGGMMMGYWMGRSFSTGVYHGGSNYTHSSVRSSGGWKSFSSSRSSGISRGGFGASGSRGFLVDKKLKPGKPGLFFN